ncbi:hypothetical protein Hanom_Chr14g01324231 [Helianthus anomalus]
MAGPGGGRGGPPARVRYFEGHVFFRKNPYVYIKYFLIRYTLANTNIGPLTKQFLWFRLVINLFGSRFRTLVSAIPTFIKA